MQKKFNGILIHSKVFKDNDLLIKFLSDTDEVFSGIVYGGLSKNKKNIMQLGFFLNLDVTYIGNRPPSIKAELSKKDNEKKIDASKIAEQINGKDYLVKKLSTENNELYGSVKPTEISKLIYEENKIDIKPSMIQPVQEIKALGKHKVKISLHSEVDAEITINVSSADTIQ